MRVFEASKSVEDPLSLVSYLCNVKGLSGQVRAGGICLWRDDSDWTAGCVEA